MVVTYWIVAALLGAFYLYSGGKKVAQSQEQLAPMMAWAGTAVPMPIVRAIGTVELLGVAGLILAPFVVPVLAVAAAVGLAVLQVLAGGFHLSRGEVSNTGLNAVLVVVAGVAAWLATAL